MAEVSPQIRRVELRAKQNPFRGWTKGVASVEIQIQTNGIQYGHFWIPYERMKSAVLHIPKELAIFSVKWAVLRISTDEAFYDISGKNDYLKSLELPVPIEEKQTRMTSYFMNLIFVVLTMLVVYVLKNLFL